MSEFRAPSLAYSLAVNYAGMVCLAVAVNLPPVLLTTLSRAVGGKAGLTNEQLGRIGAAIFVGLVVGIVVTGPLADRLGAKPFAVAGGLAVGLGLGLLGSAATYGVVLLAAIVMGLGAGVLDMVLSPIVAALQPDHRASAMNWLHSFYSIGAVATVLAASLALRGGVAWRSLALVMVPLPVLVALGFAGMRVPALVAEGHQRTRLRRLCREGYFVAALAAIFLAGGTELAMAQWLPAYAERGLGYSQWAGGIALVAFSVGMALGRVAGGVLGRRISGVPLMLGCCVLSACLYLAGSFVPWRPVALAACAAMGVAVSCLWPSMLAVAADRFPAGGASMFALLAALGNVGGIVMPWLVGAVADATSMSCGMAMGTLPPLLMAALLVWMGRRTP